MSRHGYGSGNSGGLGGRRGGGAVRTGVRHGDPQMVQVIGPGMFYPERKRIPFMAMVAWHLLRVLARMVGWTARTVWRYPLPSLAVAVVGYVTARWGLTGLGLALCVTAMIASPVVGAWWATAPASFARVVVAPTIGAWRWHTLYRRCWRQAMTGVGLARSWDGVDRVPQVARVRSSRDIDMLQVRLLPGQTPEAFSEIGSALTHVFGAFRVDVTSHVRGWVLITFLRSDPLAQSVTIRHPVYAAAVQDAHDLGADEGSSPEVTEQAVSRLLEGVPVGVTETGAVARVRVRGAHVIVAGTTGAGKSGLLWSMLWALAPAIRAGLVEVVALDPKRMELSALADGPHPLGVVVKDSDVMAAFLEGQVRALDERCTELEGRSRKHHPTRRQPHRIVIIDELATLTALAGRKDRERIEAALGHLESRGRAAGFTVVVTTVEPTKDVVRWRALHAVRVGFRLEEDSHTDMVLGDGTRARGAACDHIDPDTPGVAFLKVDGVRDPVRLRTAEITDTDLALLTNPLTRSQPEPDRPGRADLPEVATR